MAWQTRPAMITEFQCATRTERSRVKIALRGRENIISFTANNSYSFTPCNSSRYSFFLEINCSLACWYYWACGCKGHVFPRMSWQGHRSDSCWENTNYYLKVIGFCSSLINSFISGSH